MSQATMQQWLPEIRRDAMQYSLPHYSLSRNPALPAELKRGIGCTTEYRNIFESYSIFELLFNAIGFYTFSRCKCDCKFVTYNIFCQFGSLKSPDSLTIISLNKWTLTFPPLSPQGVLVTRSFRLFFYL